MKTRTALLFAVLLMAVTLPATAQHQHGLQQAPQQGQTDTPSPGGMMQGDMMGMMHQMHMQMMDQAMHNPFQHSAMLVHALPTMQDLLGLSDEQVAHLEGAAGAFSQQQSALKEKAAQAEEQLKNLLASDKPDPAQVKRLLRETATHRADLQVLGFETANRMKAELTEEQRATLAEMTPMQMHHHMATHMPMMEMMQALHGDMTPCGMMQSGNMMGDMMMMQEGGMMKQ